jgi:hypothetical protein
MKTVGRNEPCPCKSGKKYKKCCLAKDEAKRSEWVPAPSLPPVSPVSVEDPVGPQSEEVGHVSVDAEVVPNVVTGSEDEAESDDNVMDADTNGADVVTYPKPPEDSSEMTPEQDRIVSAWWDGMSPFYTKSSDCDEMIRRVETFMEEYPDLFVHLHLEDEFLFELGADLGRRKEWSRYAGLLARIREKHPETYVRCFSYYDRDMIVEQIVEGRFDAIPKYFDFFHKYPDTDPDNACEVTELLAWTDRQEELFAFATPLAIPMWTSSDVVGGWFMLRWPVLAQYVPLLDARGNPEESALALIAAVKALNIPDGPEFDVETVTREFRFRRQVPDAWDFTKCSSKRKASFVYHDVRWNYCAFLHDIKGFSWARADSLAERLEEFWMDWPEGKKPKWPFVFSEERLDGHMARTCRKILHINGIRAVSLLEAIWHFTEYLESHAWIEKKDAVDNREMCLRLFDLCVKAVESTDPVPRLMHKFPEMPCLGGAKSPLP